MSSSSREIGARNELLLSIFTEVFKQLFELFLSDGRGNVLHKEVRIESLSQVLLNRSRLFAVLRQLVVTLGDVLTHKEERAISESFLVHSDKSISSRSRFFKANEATVLLGLNMSRLDFSVFSKHCGQFNVISTGREALHEKVSELSIGCATFTSLVFGLM